MATSRLITIFTDTPQQSWRPSTFLVSTLFHGLAIGVIVLGLNRASKIVDPHPDRYTVRVVNVETELPRIHWAGAAGSTNPDSSAPAQAVLGGSRPSAASVPQQLAQLHPAPQTLIQPDLPPDILLPQETPVPLVMMWSADRNPAQKIIPPPPRPATAAQMRPSIIPPNHEPKLADLKIASAAFPTSAPSLPPSTTSPVVVVKQDHTSQVPQTTSASSDAPTAASVMSISDLRMEKGTIALPRANESAAANSSGSLTAGLPDSSSPTGNGNVAAKQNGTGVAQTPGTQAGKIAAGTNIAGKNGAGSAPAPGPGNGPGASNDAGVDRLSWPKDGHFGVVVVGASPADEYPDAPEVWAGRLAYTVYLRVGSAKSWILQYSLPRSADKGNAGNSTRPDAPWPYVIVRPHLAAGDSTSDAIMVHGFVNGEGRFEHLAIVFPAQLAQTQFVLNALQQWQFRPAMENGQITSVEVLLIIPEDEPE